MVQLHPYASILSLEEKETMLKATEDVMLEKKAKSMEVYNDIEEHVYMMRWISETTIFNNRRNNS